MDKTKAKKVREVLNKVLADNKDVFGDINVSAETANGTIKSTCLVLKVEFSDVNDEGIVETPERNDYKLYARMFDLKKEWLDQVFEDRKGNSYRITGLKPNASKRPVVVESLENGGGYVFPAVAVRKAMEEKEAAAIPEIPEEPKKPAKGKEASVEDIVNSVIAGV
jgi:hypothetical protein